MSSSSSSPSRTSRKAASLSRVYYSNAVYFPNHKIYSGYTPGGLNYSCISTVYYCFANVSTDGGVFVSPKFSHFGSAGANTDALVHSLVTSTRMPVRRVMGCQGVLAL